MSIFEHIITISVIVIATVFTRFIAFVIFPAGKETPDYIKYLGKVLPSAVIGMLVIYCYKSVDFLSESKGIPELIASMVVIVLQFWKKNMLLSIASGTILYMLLIQRVFNV